MKFPLIIDRNTRPKWLGICAAVLAGALFAGVAQPQTQAQPLALTLSVSPAAITEPFPARVSLQLHNSGPKPLWIYKPVRDVGEFYGSALNPSLGGSTLAVHLDHASAGSRPEAGEGMLASPAVGTVLESPGFPHPELIELAPGGNFTETVAIHIRPAMARTQDSPLWGNYQLSVAYSARYSNAQAIRSSVGVDVWQGSISSNVVPVTLESAQAADTGAISGVVLDHDMRIDAGVLVSLSGWDEALIAQVETGNDGGFSFESLPLGRYWVTVRWPYETEDRGFFEHADLSASQPEAHLRLIMLDEEIYDARKMLHKPVLIRVTGMSGSPVSGVALEVLWSSGTILDHVKARLNDDGLALVHLLPGSNYVTIVKHGCPKEDRMADVASGEGIDGFSFTFDCRK